MRTIGPKRRTVLLPLLLIALCALTAWMVATIWATFNPQAGTVLSSYGAGANADVTTNYSVPSGDVNYDALVAYIPPAWGVAADADVPDGTLVGTLHSEVTLGIAVGQQVCDTTMSPSFPLYDCTTAGPGFISTGDMVAGTWNGYNPVCIGQGNGERQVCQYPGFLDQLYPTRPRARYCSHTVVTAGLNATVNVLVFEPGTNLGPGIPSDPSWGYPSVVVLNDTGVPNPNPQPSSLADFCTPVVTNNTIVGEALGFVVRTNPPYGGTYVFRVWSRGLPDADGDGYENCFDTCPYDPNLSNARVPGPAGDADQDGLDDVCDPAPPSPPGDFDEDNDGYANRADNCPLIPNGPSETNQADADGDCIGDVCDNDPYAIDGTRPTVTIEIPIQISGPPPPAVGGAVDLERDPAAASARESGAPAIPYAALVGAAAAGALALAAGAWRTVRRRRT